MTSRANSPPDAKDETQDALARGDRDAFAAVYEEHLEFVMTVLKCGFSFAGPTGQRHRHVVTSHFEAEEVCQEAFSRFFEQCVRGKFDTSRPVRPYLRNIAVFVALRRAKKAFREVPLDDLELEEAPSQEADVLDAECAKLWAEFKGSLQADERTIIDRYYGDERASQAEVGKALGVSRDAVYRKLVDIKQRAVRFFNDRGWGDGS